MKLKGIFLFITVATVLGCESRLTFEELMEKGGRYTAKGDAERAIEAYRKAVAQKPDDTAAHEALGNAYYQEIVTIYRQSANNAKDWEQIKRQGSELRELAVAEYKKVLQKNKDNWKIRYRVAVELFNQKKYKESIPELQQVIQSNSKYAVAYSVLASCYLGEGEYDLALSNIEQAHDLDNDDGHYYFCLGKAYYFMNNTNRGFEMETRLKDIRSVYYRQLIVDPISRTIV